MLPGGDSGDSGKIELIIGVGLDKQSVEQTASDAKNAAKQINDAVAGAVNPSAQAAGASSAEQGRNYADLENAFARVSKLGNQAVNEFTDQVNNTDKSIKQIETDVTKMFGAAEQGAEDGAKSAAKYDAQVRLLGRAGIYAANAFLSIGVAMTAVGAAITAVATKDIQLYIKSGIDANNVSIGWTNQSARIENANVRVGRVLTGQVLPAYQAVASMVERIASFAEKHPSTAAAVAGTGVTVGVLGALLTVAATGIRIVSDFTFATATVAYVNATRQATINAAQELTAALIQKGASQEQIEAALLRKGLTVPEEATGAGGLLGKLMQMFGTGGAAGAAGKAAATTATATAAAAADTAALEAGANLARLRADQLAAASRAALASNKMAAITEAGIAEEVAIAAERKAAGVAITVTEQAALDAAAVEANLRAEQLAAVSRLTGLKNQQVVAAQASLAAEKAVAAENLASGISINARGGIGTAEYLPGGAGSLVASQALARAGTSAGIAATSLTGLVLIVGGAIASFKLLQGVTNLSINMGDKFQKELEKMGLISKEAGNNLNSMREQVRKFNIGDFLGFITSGEAGKTARMAAYNAYAESVQSQVGRPTIGSRGQLIPAITQEQANTAKQAALAFLGLSDAVNKAADAAQVLTAAQQVQLNDAKATAWVAYQKQEQRASLDNQKEINRIRAEGSKEEQRIADENAKAIADIQNKYAEQVQSAWATFNLADSRAWEDYMHNRAQTIAEGNDKIQQIEKENQKKLAELEYEHNLKMYDLASARDALGLALEQRDYQHRRSGLVDEANERIAQERKDLAARLKEQAYEFKIEEARRWEDFQIKLQDMQDQRDKELAQQKLQYEQQKKQQEDQQKDRIDTLEQQYQDEKTRRAQDFGDQMRQLNDSFYDQEKRRSEWYQRALDQADTWMKAWAEYMDPSNYLDPNNFPTPPGEGGGGTVGGNRRQAGGYARFLGRGENGIPEFVMSAQTTAAAEGLIGGKLNQYNLLERLAGGGGSSLTWNDHRTFQADYTRAVQRQVEADTLSVLERIFVHDS